MTLSVYIANSSLCKRFALIMLSGPISTPSHPAKLRKRPRGEACRNYFVYKEGGNTPGVQLMRRRRKVGPWRPYKIDTDGRLLSASSLLSFCQQKSRRKELKGQKPILFRADAGQSAKVNRKNTSPGSKRSHFVKGKPECRVIFF